MAKKELLWVQLARDLAYAIATGRYPVGTLLPKELDICRKTGLLRHTVRAALDHLQRTGLIKRTPHVGTEVVARGAARGFAYRLQSFSDVDMIGHSHAREVCQSIHVKVDKEKAQELGLPAGTSWVRLTNIRAGDKPEDPPVVCTQVFILEVWEDVVAAAAREPETLIATLINRMHGVVCSEVKQDVSAVAMPVDQAAWLQCKPGVPALKIRRVYLDESGKPLEVSVSWHPGDRYSFSISLQQNAAD